MKCSLCISNFLERISQLRSVGQSCPILWDPMNCSTPGLPVYHQLPESSQTHVHWVGDATQPSHLLPFPSPPALNFSEHQGLFKWVNSSHQVAKILEFQLNISPSNEHPDLISFRIDWLGLLAVQRTLKIVFQHHISKASMMLYEEISSFSHSIVFLYVFVLIAEEGFLISPCNSLWLCIQIGASFLSFFGFCFSSIHILLMENIKISAFIDLANNGIMRKQFILELILFDNFV